MKYTSKNNDNLIDIESKIADIIHKIFTGIFIGILGLVISIYNLKLNDEKAINELFATTIKQMEESRNLSIERYLEPMLFAQQMSGMPVSKNKILEYLSSNDPEYQLINKNFLEITNKLQANVKNRFENLNLTTYILITFLIGCSFMYIFFQGKMLIKLIQYKKDLIKNNDLEHTVENIGS